MRAVSSEASDAVNKSLVVLDAVDSAGVPNFSLKLTVGVDVGPLRNLSANVGLGRWSQGSRPADHGSIISFSTRHGGVASEVKHASGRTLVMYLLRNCGG